MYPFLYPFLYPSSIYIRCELMDYRLVRLLFLLGILVVRIKIGNPPERKVAGSTPAAGNQF
jgi:hypothetical protein